jgi:hypothetical protein
MDNTIREQFKIATANLERNQVDVLAEIIYKNTKDKDYYATALGTYLGYKKCCVESFREETNVFLDITAKTGITVCQTCAKNYTEEEIIERIESNPERLVTCNVYER